MGAGHGLIGVLLRYIIIVFSEEHTCSISAMKIDIQNYGEAEQ
jgi:hypothetical protein